MPKRSHLIQALAAGTPWQVAPLAAQAAARCQGTLERVKLRARVPGH